MSERTQLFLLLMTGIAGTVNPRAPFIIAAIVGAAFLLFGIPR